MARSLLLPVFSGDRQGLASRVVGVERSDNHGPMRLSEVVGIALTHELKDVLSAIALVSR